LARPAEDKVKASANVIGCNAGEPMVHGPGTARPGLASSATGAVSLLDEIAVGSAGTSFATEFWVRSAAQPDQGIER
jgi:hypothetical protein